MMDMVSLCTVIAFLAFVTGFFIGIWAAGDSDPDTFFMHGGYQPLPGKDLGLPPRGGSAVRPPRQSGSGRKP